MMTNTLPAAIVGVIYGISLIYSKFHKQNTQSIEGSKTMKQYVPVEVINAAEIVSLSAVTVTTALLDDDSTITVPNEAFVGAYALQASDGAISLLDKATFEAKFRAV